MTSAHGFSRILRAIECRLPNDQSKLNLPARKIGEVEMASRGIIKKETEMKSICRARIMLVLGFMILFLAACRAAGTPTAVKVPVTAATDVANLIFPTQTLPPSAALQRIEMLQGYKIKHILRPSLFMPTDIKIGPDGRIFFYEMDGNRILELGYDGEISTVIQLDTPINGILINSAGDLFVMQGEEIIKISVTGEKSVFRSGIINIRGWAFDAQDNLYVNAEGELMRLSPDGEERVISTNVKDGSMTISPDGDIFIASGSEGRIFKVTQDGAISTLATEFVHDAFNIAFDNLGHLYQNQLMFTQVSLEDGSLSPPVLREYSTLLLSRPFAFTPSGEAVFIGPTSNNAILASIEKETASVLVAGIGNSHGMAVDSSGNVFMGASNEFPLFPGRVISVSSNGSTSDFATGFFRIRDLIFDDEGNMFVSDIDQVGDGGSRLTKISPGGSRSVILSSYHDLISMVFNPANDEILAFDLNQHQLLRLTQDGAETIIPMDFGGEAMTIDLALDKSSEFIALVVFQENYNTGPVHRGLYRISSDYQATLITEINTPLATSEDDVFVAPSGEIYVVGPEEHPNFRLLRISLQGEVTAIARYLPYDTLSLAINNAGEIYFTCSAGLFKVSREE